LPDGCEIYGEVSPETDPPALLRPVGNDIVKITLLLENKHDHFESLTCLPEHRPGRQAFYFSNLFEDIENNRLHLTDPLTHKRVSDPVEVVTSTNYTCRVAPPDPGVELSLTDVMGNKVVTLDYTVSLETEAFIELTASLAGVPAGRYTLKGNRDIEIYYDPDLFGKRLIGIVELFANTERVPSGYRFLSDQTITTRDYCIQFESAEMEWRYRVAKRHGTNGFPMEGLSVSGPFESLTENNDIIFRSREPIPLAEKPYGFELRSNGNRVQTLPGPNIRSSLKKVYGKLVSEMNVYI
jgi:hypothetical protein